MRIGSIIKRTLVVAAAVAGVVVAVGLITAAVILIPKYQHYKAIADSFDLSEINRIPAISEVFDRRGNRYSRIEGEVRYVIPIEDVSDHFIKALLAREDSRFYEHNGIDLKGILRAASRNLAEGEIREGASTITQQLARNTFSLSEDRWERKIVEALLAMRIERNLTKSQILDAYVNRIFYGRGLFGLETAARACFGKSAKSLDLSEAAILAGLIRSPNNFTPLENTEHAIAERNDVLARMVELEYITMDEASDAMAKDVPLAKRMPPVLQRDYAIDAVKRDLEVILSPDQIAQGGLKIYTTIDRRLQLLGTSIVDKHLAELEKSEDWKHPRRADYSGQGRTEYIQGSLMAIDNATGGILAVVGGRDYLESPYNRAVLAQRQVGSTFKPFVYAAAFERGLLPGTWVDDGALQPQEIEQLGGKWNPRNADRDSAGTIPAAMGLIRSRNLMTIRIGQMASLDGVVRLGTQAGIISIPPYPSSYLGAFEATLKEITGAYLTFPNGGLRKQPHIISHIVDRRGETIYKANQTTVPVIRREVDSVVDELLQDVVIKGTAAKARKLGLSVPAAGKTGTTDNYKDAWFIGYTSSITCGVWVGLDEPKPIMAKGYGSTLALPIWVDFITKASERDFPAQELGIKAGRQEIALCRVTGLRATNGCLAAQTAYNSLLPAALHPRHLCNHYAPQNAVADQLAYEPAHLPSQIDEDLPVARAEPIAQPYRPSLPHQPRPARIADAPVARAIPVATPSPKATPTSGNYIRTPDGFIFH